MTIVRQMKQTRVVDVLSIYEKSFSENFRREGKSRQ